MKKLLKTILTLSLYCLGYLITVNVAASFVNKTMDTVTLDEVFSFDAMKSGQRDVFTYVKFKIKDIELESIKQEVLKEIEKY